MTIINGILAFTLWSLFLLVTFCVAFRVPNLLLPDPEPDPFLHERD